MRPLHYSELVRYILQAYNEQWPNIPWYTVFYHEPPARLRHTIRHPWHKVNIAPLGHEEWLIHWARSKGYIDAEGEQRALAAWTLHLME